MNNILCENLKRLRLAKHYTQEQAAELLGVGAQTVSRWECGATLPDVMLLPELARLYCVAIDELYRPAAAAYANEAQRLASVYKASRAPADFVRADQEFRRMRRLGQCTAEDLRQWGVMNQFMMCSCMRQAEALFDEALTQGDGAQRGSVKRQRLYFLNLIGRGEEGIREQEALAREKRDAEEEACLIAAYQFAGQGEKGYECFCRAVKKAPDAAVLYVLGGECLKLMGRMEEAVACWEKALALDPGQCEAQSTLGFYYEEQGCYEQAYAVWRAMEQRLESGGCDAERQIANRRAQRCLEKMQGA